MVFLPRGEFGRRSVLAPEVCVLFALPVALAGFLSAMSELHHECGLAAVYHLPGREISPLCPAQGPEEVSRLVPRMLLDIQNRGQLSAGMTSFNTERNQLLDTYKEVGNVTEVF